jgi:hypothetical protein
MFEFLNFRKVEDIRLDKVVERCYELEGDLKKLTEDNDKLHRIIENYVVGEITYKNKGDIDNFYYGLLKPTILYVYKDGKEFEFKYLILHDAKFEQVDKKNVILVTDIVKENDEEVEKQYVLNLNDCSFIQTK